MNFDFDTGTIYGGLATLDVTTLPPLGSGPANILSLVGSGALTLIQGTTAERPAAAGGTDIEGMFRYNTSITQLEYFDGTNWQQLTSTAGTVSSFQTDLDGLTPQTATTGAVTLSGTLGTTSGGTGATSAPTAGQFLYSSGGSTYSATTLSGFAVTTFSAGTTGFTPNSATSGAITLAGTLVLANGGTGASLVGVAGAPVYSDTTSSFAVGTAGSTGQAYISGGTSAPTWQTVSSDIDANPGAILAGDGAGAFTATSGTFVGSGTYSGLTLNGTVTNGTDATTKDYVDSLANGLSWKQSVIAGTTGYVDLSTGGLLTIDGYTVADGDRVLVKDQGTGAIIALDGLVGGTGYTASLTGAGPYVLDGGNNDATATFDTDGSGVVTAVTLVNPGTGYTDNESLTSSAFDVAEGGSGFSIVVNGVRTAAENGIYISHAGAWIRSEDMDSTTPTNEINGAAVFVENGAVNADTAWVQTATVNTINVDPIVWVQFGGPGSYTAGNGLTLSGNQFSLSSPVSIANGGTALTSTPTNGQLLIGNGSGYTLAGLTAGTGIDITPASGAITISNTGVTSIAGTANEITASAATGSVTLSLPSTLIAPGSLEVTTTFQVDTFTPNSMLYVTTGGEVVSTAALTDGQILIGDTGSVPVAGTVTGGTGITVTNGAGTITIDVDNTEIVTSFSAGTTGLTPSTPSYGDIVLAGTLATTNGGTGLTTIGTANQFLAVDTGATGLEYKTISAGTGISVVPGAGVLTIANTGVTSVALSDGSGSPIYTISGSPVTTTGTLTFTLDTQTANTVFAGPTTGSAAEPTFRALVLDDLSGALQLYRENPSTPTAPSATGSNAVAIGSGSTATADESFAEGAGSAARLYGMKAFANGSFATAGDAQAGIYVLRNQTTDATLTELFLDGASAQIVLADNSVYVFDILVAGRRTDATGGGAGYRFVGVARKDSTAGSVTFVGTPSKTVIGETNTPWNAAVSVDTSTGAFRVRVTGEAAKDINWVATVMTTEVTN